MKKEDHTGTFQGACFWAKFLIITGLLLLLQRIGIFPQEFPVVSLTMILFGIYLLVINSKEICT